MKPAVRNVLLACSTVVWISAMAFGMRALSRYADISTDSGGSRLALLWPEDSPIRLGNAKATLVVFLHPKCPCSRASIAELDRVMARTNGAAQTYAVFVRPPGFRDEEVRGELWERARQIPGVQLVLDEGGEEARRFGATSSGHLFAFDGVGRARYSGPITPARGHMGDSPGEESVVAFVNRGLIPPAVAHPGVFGCALFDSKHDHDHGESSPGERAE